MSIYEVNKTNFTIDELKESFADYFFEGEGQIYCPYNETTVKKPGRKIKAFLCELGFNCIQCTLEQTDYHIRLWNPGHDNLWFDVTVDYWNYNIYVD